MSDWPHSARQLKQKRAGGVGKTPPALDINSQPFGRGKPMQENSNTPAHAGEDTTYNHDCFFTVTLGERFNGKLTAAEHLATAYKLTLYLNTLMWMMSVLDFNRLDAEGENLESVCPMVNFHAELSERLTDEIGHHIQSAEMLLEKTGGAA